MEGHDTFTQNTEIGDEDPFAGSDFGDWEQPGSDSPAQPASPAPPAVAEPVPGPATPPQSSVPSPAPTPSESQAAEATPPAPDGEATPSGWTRDALESATTATDSPPDPTPDESGGTTGSTTETEPASEPPPAQEPAIPDSGTELPPEAQNGAQSAESQAGVEAERREQEGDVPIDTADLPEPTGYDRDATRVLSDDDLEEAGYDGPVAQDGEVPVTHPAHPVNHQQPQSEPSDAPPPDETTDKRGRVTHRRYYIFTWGGDDTYKMLSWFEDEQHQITSRNVRGAKRQTVVLAKTPEDALKFGYVAAGAPQEGLTLVPCAVQNFQPKTVAPEPPEPMKQRLRIS